MLQTTSFNNILSLNPTEAVEIVMKPVTVNPNILLRDKLKLYHWDFGKDKVTMIHLTSPRNIIQPKMGCDVWRPRGRAGLSPSELSVTDHEIMLEYCYDDFESGVLRNMMPAKDESKNSNLDKVDFAISSLIRESLVNDFYKLAWFSNENIEAQIIAGRYNIQDADLLDMLKSNNGFWAEIEAYVSTGQIRYVDTNDGTNSGNAVKKQNIVEYLREVKKRSTILLKSWNRQSASYFDRPYFLLQSGLFDALKSYYQDLDLSEAMSLKMNGEDVPGFLKFDGHLCIDMSEWEALDFEAGAFDDETGYSKNQRCLFIAPEVLSGLINAKNLSGQPYSFNVQRSPDQRDKGKTSIYGKYGYGFGIAHNDLVTAGYNSSFDYN